MPALQTLAVGRVLAIFGYGIWQVVESYLGWGPDAHRGRL
jgi:hypothetical protein